MKQNEPRGRERTLKHLTKLIQREVAYFNGWSVSEETMQKDCERAAMKILRYLRGRT